MGETRSFTGGRFVLVLDGSETLGYAKSVKGGTIKGELATHNLGPAHVQKKHLATISYEPFVIEAGMEMGEGFYAWIRASLDKGHITKTGEVIALDFDYKTMSRREFVDCHIAEVTIPKLDGSSKEPAYMTIKLDPEEIRYQPGDSAVVPAQRGRATKKWLRSNFRLEVGDLPCSRVASVDSFTWKQSVITDRVGRFRRATKRRSKVTVPNVILTISMADVDPWQRWHKDFVIDGNCGDEAELSGSITFLGPDMKEEFAVVELLHLGIISLEYEEQEANAASVARFKVEMYCEEMKLSYSVKDAFSAGAR